MDIDKLVEWTLYKLAARMGVIDLQPLSCAEPARRLGAFSQTLLDGKLKPALLSAAEPDMQALAARVVIREIIGGVEAVAGDAPQ